LTGKQSEKEVIRTFGMMRDEFTAKDLKELVIRDKIQQIALKIDKLMKT